MKKVELISIPKKEEDIKAGTLCTVAGWGSLRTDGKGTSSSLMEANTTVLSQAECKEKWKGEFFEQQMICVHGKGGTCRVSTKDDSQTLWFCTNVLH